VTPTKGNLTRLWTATHSPSLLEEGDWQTWLGTVNDLFVPAIIDEAIAALTAVPVVYGWDGKQWNVVPWTLPGDVPSLIGYRGGPLHVCTSHDPAPVGDPKAPLLVAGAGIVMVGNINATPVHGAPCQIIGCYIEPQP